MPYVLRDGCVAPSYLDASDLPWIDLLMEEYGHFAGKPRALLTDRFREPLTFYSPRRKRELLLHVLNKLWSDTIQSAVTPAKVRETVFLMAASGPAPRSVIIERAASKLAVTVAEIEQALFADLKSERIMVPPDEVHGPYDLLLKANLMLVQGLLCRSRSVQIWLLGNARRVVRHAKLTGLICSVTHDAPGEEAKLSVSGPLSLFRHTTMYGRALAQLVPYLNWCHRYRLQSEVVLRGEALRFELTSGAHILPAKTPNRFDSQVEQRFARDFGKLAPEWSLVREPDPIAADGTLIFPDFALIHTQRPRDKWHLEILGFWTPEYLKRKLQRLHSAGLKRLILCIDEARHCGESDFPAGARVVRYKRRIDAQQILNLLR